MFGLWIITNGPITYGKNTLIEKQIEVPALLFHLDYHWDAVNDYNKPERIAELVESKINDLFCLVDEDFITKDSFIAPAIIRGLIDEIHFYCMQFDNEIGFSEPFKEEYSISEEIHYNTSTILNTVIQKEVIFDIDLDLFNRSDNFLIVDLWQEEEIIQFIDICIPLISQSTVVTIAMSSGYSGTDVDTRYLTNLLIQQLNSKLVY